MANAVFCPVNSPAQMIGWTGILARSHWGHLAKGRVFTLRVLSVFSPTEQLFFKTPRIDNSTSPIRLPFPQTMVFIQMYPSHEAFRLLNKWKNDQTAIRLLLTLSFGVGSFIGKVASVEVTNVRFVSGDASSDFLLSLNAASFEYRTQREQSESTISDKYKRSLIATFPSKAKIVFSEL